MKKLTKCDMAYEIGKKEPYNGAHLYWDKMKWEDVNKEYQRVINAIKNN